MTIFQTVSVFQPEITIDYDVEREQFVGTLLSRGGYSTIEAPNYSMVINAIEDKLYHEHSLLEREITQDRPGRAISFGGGSTGGTIGMGIASGGAYSKGDGSRTKSRSRGGGSKSLFDVSGVFDLFGKVTAAYAKQYVAVVAGVSIVATSRRRLKKKIILHRNRNIQRIMMNVRTHKQNVVKASAHERVALAADRLRKKRQYAKMVDPVDSRKSERSQAGSGDWHGRVKNIRTRIRDRKERAREFIA